MDIFFDPMGAWTLWKHCNQCVFDGASPSLATALSQAEEERAVWELVGTKGITFLMVQLQGGYQFGQLGRLLFCFQFVLRWMLYELKPISPACSRKKKLTHQITKEQLHGYPCF
jgi:hypothetical protein